MSNFTGIFTPKEKISEFINSQEGLKDFGAMQVSADVQHATIDDSAIYLFGEI